ncbi:sodium:proton antiporter [Marinoscillum sp. 108]|uniref:cation:proton antiporter n=1 Tax=Marinoscillum sp. 108 TaxID=2653151 RepID=UPI0012F28179|nr:sodium:proton antiporter [Marinoscillum sp. 108]VXD11504.1 Sodium/proton antiporter (CPA1 family) [Marinoscillum sp. 108]
MHIFDLIALIIFVSGLFIFLNTLYLKLPSSLGLMILTLILSVVILMTEILFPQWEIATEIKSFDFRDVLNQMVISVILFAGGLNMDINKLGTQKLPIIILSIVGAIISTLVIGTILYYVLNGLNIEISYMYSLVFGAVISSTDPISSSNTTKRFSLPKILEIKLEGESLFNGAFSVVLAFVLYHVAIVTGDQDITFVTFAQILLLEILGGITIGVLMGFIGFRLLKFIDNDDVHIEVLITIALVLVGSFISGFFSIYSKMVSLIMGLLIGYLSRGGANPVKKGEEIVGSYVYKFWNLMEETMAVMLFVLMGLEMLVLDWRMEFFAAGFIAVNVVLFGRWVSIFIPVKLMSGRFDFDKNTIPVMTWGAFRGGLPIALILALHNFPGKELLITMTYVVVVCSILFQGFTLPIMMRERFVNRVA